MSYERLLDEIEAWRGAYEARNPAPVTATSKPAAQPMMVKSLRRVPAKGEMLKFIKRVRGHGSHSEFEDFVKSLDAAEAGPDPILDAQTAAKRDGDARDAKAKWLRGIIRQVDAAMASGNLTADEVAKLENMIHRAAQKIGAV